MNFRIRLAALGDSLELTSLFNSDTNIFGEDGIGFGEQDIKEYVLDKKKKLFVCEYEDRIVGALMADYHETYSHLETLIVNKSFQKNGAGSALLNHYEKDLEMLKIPLIEVLTEVDNDVMQKILEDRGFRKGNTFVFYSKGE
jgi:ribosomal protein S18 acetylase RimI-like enzyme